MKTTKIIIIVSVIGFIGFGCAGKENTPPEELIQGKWLVDEAELLGATIPGDGSYLTFNACDGAGLCGGVDYMADGGTTGSFTYTLYAEDSLVIVDTISNGGAWTATWDILELTKTRLRMIANSIFGTVKYEFDKQ